MTAQADGLRLGAHVACEEHPDDRKKAEPDWTKRTEDNPREHEDVRIPVEDVVKEVTAGGGPPGDLHDLPVEGVEQTIAEEERGPEDERYRARDVEGSRRKTCEEQRGPGERRGFRPRLGGTHLPKDGGSASEDNHDIHDIRVHPVPGVPVIAISTTALRNRVLNRLRPFSYGARELLCIVSRVTAL